MRQVKNSFPPIIVAERGRMPKAVICPLRLRLQSGIQLLLCSIISQKRLDRPGNMEVHLFNSRAADSPKRESQVGGTWLPKRET